MIKYYSVNGALVPKETAALGVSDLAILRGYGLFDYFLVISGQPLFFEDYLDRFWSSAEQLQLEVPVSRKELARRIFEVIRANGELNAAIRLVLTGGYAADGYTPPGRANLLILEHALPTYPASKYDDGSTLMLYEYQRPLPTTKTINYVVGINLLPQMIAAGAEDLLFHFGGFITETTRANFFIVKENGTIVTAGEGILEGVTRKHALHIARQHYKVEERALALDELQTAKEAFITSTTKRVMPVVRVGGTIIGNGKPGEVSRRLFELLREEEDAYLMNKESMGV
ncbi:MAG: amino acid aminotransferase [Saprospiraceae bacterium]|nr:MAG: amino acid aminotransferase [Saprospiraceae bacterium]